MIPSLANLEVRATRTRGGVSSGLSKLHGLHRRWISYSYELMFKH